MKFTYRIFTNHLVKDFEHGSTFAKVIIKHQTAYFFGTRCILNFVYNHRHLQPVISVEEFVSLRTGKDLNKTTQYSNISVTWTIGPIKFRVASAMMTSSLQNLTLWTLSNFREVGCREANLLEVDVQILASPERHDCLHGYTG